MGRYRTSNVDKSVGRRALIAKYPPSDDPQAAQWMHVDTALMHHPNMLRATTTVPDPAARHTIVVQDSMYVLRSVYTLASKRQQQQSVWTHPDASDSMAFATTLEEDIAAAAAAAAPPAPAAPPPPPAPVMATWQEYVLRFRRVVLEHFRSYPNVRRVVLCFDKHQYVPLAKSAVQQNRDAAMIHPDDLPPLPLQSYTDERVPERINDYLSDRECWRKRILAWVCLALLDERHPQTCLHPHLAPHQSVVVDGHCISHQDTRRLCHVRTGAAAAAPAPEIQSLSDDSSADAAEDDAAAQQKELEQFERQCLRVDARTGKPVYDLSRMEIDDDDNTEYQRQEASSSEEEEEESSSSEEESEALPPVHIDLSAPDREDEAPLELSVQRSHDRPGLELVTADFRVQRRPDLQNRMGEGDLSVFFHARQAHNEGTVRPNVVIYATDTDFLYLGLAYCWKMRYVWHQTQSQQCQLYIHKHHRGPHSSNFPSGRQINEHMHLNLLARLVQQDKRLESVPAHTRLLTLCCCMAAGGGDYIEKHYGVSYDAFLEMLYVGTAHVRDLVRVDLPPQQQQPPQPFEELYEGFALVYSRYCQLVLGAHLLTGVKRSAALLKRQHSAALKRQPNQPSPSEEQLMQLATRNVHAALAPGASSLTPQQVNEVMTGRKVVPSLQDMRYSCLQLCYYARMMLCVGERHLPDEDLCDYAYSAVNPELGMVYKNIYRVMDENDADADRPKRKRAKA